MNTVSFNGKNYATDSQGFLADHGQWDEDFAAGMAPGLGIQDRLGEGHWEVIRFIRDRFRKTGECPLVFEVCKHTGASYKKMKDLFPSGYLRGACRLAGITYASRRVNYYGEESDISRPKSGNGKGRKGYEGKVYTTDVFGFLTDPAQWDENFAAHRVAKMKVKGGVSGKHWEIIKFLRKAYQETGIVPTVFACCEANRIDLEELEDLFPAGYHRGAVKAAGLRFKEVG